MSYLYDDLRTYLQEHPSAIVDAGKHLFHVNSAALEWRLASDMAEPRIAQQIGQRIQDPIKKIIKMAIDATCTILVNAPEGDWTGSGFHLGHGIIATAGHVAPQELQNNSNASITITFDSQTMLPAQLLGSDPNIDAALLMCPQASQSAPTVKLGNSDTLEVGDIIAVIGSPEGFARTATVGRVSNIHQGLGNQAPSPAWNDIIFIDAEIAEGASGGLCIATDGLVYGSVMGVTGGHADVGVGERAICPSNKILALAQQVLGAP